MANSEYTQEQLDDLNEAIATGARKVVYNDRTVEFRSLKEMLQLREIIKRCLGISKKSGGGVLPEASKGIC